MDVNMLSALSFGLGVLIQCFLLVKFEKLRDKWFYFPILLLIIVLSFSLSDKKNDWVSIIYLSCGVFAFLYISLMIKDIVHSINEHILIFQTLLLWYLILFNDGFIRYPILFLSILPSLFVVHLMFSKKKITYKIKFFCYVWFAMSNFFILVLHVNLSELFVGKVGSDHLFFGMLKGMIFTLLLSNISVLYCLLPIPGKGTNLSTRWREVKDFANHLTLHVTDKHIQPLHAVLLVVVILAITMVQYYYSIVTQSTIVSLLLVASQFYNT